MLKTSEILKKTTPFVLIALLALPKTTFAHCPLCTVGAGALAVLAASMGVSAGIVGIFIGTFASVLSLYLNKLIKKVYFKGQQIVIVALVYLSTVIPIAPLVRDYDPLYISWIGEYGTLLNNTYTIDLYWYGIILGTIAVAITPFISKTVTKIRGGKKINYQRMIVMFALVVILSVITQLIFPVI